MSDGNGDGERTSGTMRRTIEVESSQFSPRSYWVPGAEYYAEDVTVEYPDELDTLEDNELLEMAGNEQGGVVYVHDDVQVHP